MAFYTPDSKGNAPSGLNVGDLVKTAGGVYEVTQPNAVGSRYNPESGYWSVLADPAVIASNKLMDQARELAATNTAKSQDFAREQMNFQTAANAKAMDFNAAEAERNRQWQAEMSNSAHQREVQDLINAGLNPILSATGGNGAAVTSGATASGYTASGASGSVDNSYIALLSKIIDSSTSLKMTALNNKNQYDIAALNARINQDVANIHAAATLGSSTITAENAMNMLGVSNEFTKYMKTYFPDSVPTAIVSLAHILGDAFLKFDPFGLKNDSSDDEKDKKFVEDLKSAIVKIQSDQGYSKNYSGSDYYNRDPDWVSKGNSDNNND